MIKVSLLIIIGLCLYAYFWAYVPESPEHYKKITLENASSYGYGDRRSRRIIIRDGGNSYILFYSEFGEKYDQDVIIKSINNSKKIDLWISSSGNVDVKGILADGFYIDPVKGYERAKGNQNAALILAMFFVILLIWERKVMSKSIT